ncbi:MAG: GNAT family N-acetyltransferase [Chitinivibrionales bacterium]|nr:GNAT family N-acetyltransferase [Chitinivibrionales bacterium]
MPTEKRPFPDTIEGELVCLRRFEEAHVEPIFEAIQRDRQRLLRFLPWPRYINSVADELEFIRGSREHFDAFTSFGYGIYPRVADSFAGTIGSFNVDCDNMKFEVGYWLLGSAEGKGYMTEALELLLHEHAVRGFHRAELQCEPENARSRAVAERCGFRYEGTLRECQWNGEAFLDMQVYGRLLSTHRP